MRLLVSFLSCSFPREREDVDKYVAFLELSSARALPFDFVLGDIGHPDGFSLVGMLRFEGVVDVLHSPRGYALII